MLPKSYSEGDRMINSAVRMEKKRERELQVRAISFFTDGHINCNDALDGLKGGRQIDVRGGPLSRITHITSLAHLRYLISRWDLESQFEYEDDCVGT